MAGNHSSGQMPMGVFGQAEFQGQSQYMNHHQMNSRNGPTGSAGASSALQQLFIQSQQRNMNDNGRVMGRGGGDTGPALSPTSNQLARWFSPELLAQATAGKLPPVPTSNMPNALSLEELERIQKSATVHN